MLVYDFRRGIRKSNMSSLKILLIRRIVRDIFALFNNLLIAVDLLLSSLHFSSDNQSIIIFSKGNTIFEFPFLPHNQATLSKFVLIIPTQF